MVSAKARDRAFSINKTPAHFVDTALPLKPNTSNSIGNHANIQGFGLHWKTNLWIFAWFPIEFEVFGFRGSTVRCLSTQMRLY